MSCLGVSNDGMSLCTGSWDSTVSGNPRSTRARIDVSYVVVESLGVVMCVVYETLKREVRAGLQR